jgi:hypothetical protein
MGKTDSYNKCDDLCKLEHLWIPIGKKGSKECAWVHISDIPFVKQMRAELNLLLGFQKARAEVGKIALEKNGKRGTKSEVGNDYNKIQNSDMILDGEEAYAITFLNGYVDKYIMATKIYHNELPEGFSADGTWFINADGILERDMDKVAEKVL